MTLHEFASCLCNISVNSSRKKNQIQVKRKESGTIPNSFSKPLMFNPSNFLGSLQESRGFVICFTTYYEKEGDAEL